MKKYFGRLVTAVLAAVICIGSIPLLAVGADSAKSRSSNIALGNQSVDPRIFDGDESTGWTFQYDTMTIDLGSVYRIDRVDILSSTSNVSVNGWGQTGRTDYAPIEGQNARYICLTDYTYYRTQGADASVLYEVRVYGRKMENLALGNTSASGYENWFDGRKDTATAFMAADIVIDLGAVYAVNTINIDVRETRGRVAVSRYSMDNKTWVHDAPTERTRLRYFVVSDYGRYSQKVFSVVNEIEVYGDKVKMKNAALHCVTEGEEAAMYDGDESTGWTCTYYDFVVDLGVEYEVAYVDIVAQTTHSVAVQRYSADNVAWQDGSPSYGAKARYLVVTDYGYYWGGNIPSTIYEIKVNVEEEIGELENAAFFAELVEVNGPAGAECLIDGREEAGYSGGSVVLDLGRECLIERVSAVRGSIAGAFGSLTGIDYFPISSGARARYVLVSNPVDVAEIVIKVLPEESSPFLIRNVAFVSDGVTVAALAPRKSMGAAVTLANLIGYESTAVVYFGIYNEKGLLVAMKRAGQSIPAYSVAEVKAELDTSDLDIKEGYSAKAFLWTDQEMEPLMKTEIMNNYIY